MSIIMTKRQFTLNQIENGFVLVIEGGGITETSIFLADIDAVKNRLCEELDEMQRILDSF